MTRPLPEIATLIQAAYGADPTRLQSSLNGIARALNRGDLARATIMAVFTRTPELNREAAARLADIAERLVKYNADEPRDWHGRWISDGSARPANAAPPTTRDAASQVADASGSVVSNHEQSSADRNASVPPAGSEESDKTADESREPSSLQETLERKYDDLGPVDFAKQVIQFGDRLGREGKNLSPAEREQTLAEYSFLQDRLSFWLAYDYKPAIAQANLLSSALTLYQGAINGGIARAGDVPRSMLDVGGAVWAFDNVPPGVRRAPKPIVGEPPPSAAHLPKEIEGLGGIVDNSEVGIKWNKGIKDQGDNWELYNEKVNPDGARLQPNSKTFDQYNLAESEAISNKTLNTLSVSYIKNPLRIYSRLKRYVNDAADYEPRVDSDLDSAEIRSKTIHLAIPEYTSPAQWGQLFQAIIYGKERGVRIVITRIRE
ncbi:MAG: endonuclease toxin domain-containing protein [Methylovirgula sp.]